MSLVVLRYAQPPTVMLGTVPRLVWSGTLMTGYSCSHTDHHHHHNSFTSYNYDAQDTHNV